MIQESTADKYDHLFFASKFLAISQQLFVKLKPNVTTTSQLQQIQLLKPLNGQETKMELNKEVGLKFMGQLI